ncbi:MAG: glutathione synthase, partial [Rhodospirillales bacterium]|nr:glutathione synthase [Rhodospirillales bacterium]
MSLSVAIQMDHVSSIDIRGDSTFVMALEAQHRGYELFHYLPESLSHDQGKVVARAEPMRVWRDEDKHYELGVAMELDLASVDVVLMRQDPPFDMGYITATHIL